MSEFVSILERLRSKRGVGSRNPKAKIQKNFQGPGAIKMQNWIRKNPNFDYSKYSAQEIAKFAGVKKINNSVANKVLVAEGKDSLRVAQAKEKAKLYSSKEFKDFLKEKNVSFKDFLKLTPDQRDKKFLYSFQRIKSVRNKLPNKGAGYISGPELAKILEPYGINYGTFGVNTKRSTNYLQPTLLAQKINKLLDSKAVSSTGEGTFGKQKTKITGERVFSFYKKPTKAQVQEIVKFKDASNIRDFTVKGMQVLDKKLKNDFESKKFPSLEKTQKILKDAGLRDTPAVAARAMSTLARAYRGTPFQNDLGNIKVNKKLGNYIQKEFGTYDLLHPWRQGVYRAALDDIKNAVGDQAGDLKKFKNKFDQFLIKNYPGTRKFDLNEVFSVTASARNKSYPYAYFVDIVDSNLNQIDLASFHGQMSFAEERISDQIKKYRRTGNIKFYREAERIKDTFNNRTRKSFLETIKKNYPGRSVNLTTLEIGKPNQVLKNINFAEDYYKQNKLQKWKNLGIDLGEHSAKAGYLKTGADKKGVLAIQEFFDSNNKINPSKVNEFLKDVNFVKKYASSKGVTFNSFAGFVDFTNTGIELPSAVKQSAQRVMKAIAPVVRGAGKAAVVIDPLFAAMDYSKAMGEGVSGTQATSFTGQKFLQDIINLPRTLEDLAYVATDKGTFKNFGQKPEQERLFSYKPKTFADDYLQKTIESTPQETLDYRKAVIDFDQRMPTFTDEIEIPRTKEDIEREREEFFRQKGVTKPVKPDFTSEGIMGIVPPKGVI